MKRTITMGAGSISVDTTALRKLKADLKANGRARVHVGILGASTFRVASAEDHSPVELTNAELGAIHEFGVTGEVLNHSSRDADRKSRAQWDQFKEQVNIPARSFLRMPVITHLPDALQKTNRGQWGRVLLEKGILHALGLLGAYALAAIHEAFESGGFGSWAPLSRWTIRRKGSSAILIDSAQMRQAITAEVIKP